jgi:hypothetical protein
MESFRRRPSSHMRENHSLGPDRPFLVKRHRDRSREQMRILSEDEDPPSRGEKQRRKKRHAPSFNTSSNSGPRSGLPPDTFVERPQRPPKQKHGASRSFTDVPTNIARPTPRGRREAPHEGKLSSARAPSAVAVSDDEMVPQSSYSGPITSLEFGRMKRELETLKKVCLFRSSCVVQLMEPVQQAAAHNKTIDKQANVGGLSSPHPPSP